MNTKMIKELEKALASLKAAQKSMEAVRKLAHETNDHGMAGSAWEYNRQISEIISCDHGEAGLEPLVQWIALNTK